MMQLMYCTYKRENTPSWKQLRLKLTTSKPRLYSKKGVAKRLALPTSDHGVAGSNPAGGEILPEVTGRFAHFPVRPESFRPESFRPRVVSPSIT